MEGITGLFTYSSINEDRMREREARLVEGMGSDQLVNMGGEAMLPYSP